MDLPWVILLVVSAGYLAYLVIFVAYFPAGPKVRSRLVSGDVQHFVPSRFLVFDPISGRVTLNPHPRSYNPFLRTGLDYLFVYLGNNHRGGRLNHSASRGPHALVVIDGTKFASAVGSSRLYWRWWDRAIAVAASYSGPAEVTPNVNPRAVRSRRNASWLRP